MIRINKKLKQKTTIKSAEAITINWEKYIKVYLEKIRVNLRYKQSVKMIRYNSIEYDYNNRKEIIIIWKMKSMNSDWK